LQGSGKWRPWCAGAFSGIALTRDRYYLTHTAYLRHGPTNAADRSLMWSH